MLRVLPMAKKWDSDATPSEKLLLLFVLLLFNNRPFSLSELSSTWLNASKATVLRLLGQLESAKIGVLKREKRGRESYYSLDHDRPPDFSLNREAIDQLSLCRDFILYLLPKKMQHDTAMTIGRLAALAGNGGRHEAGSVGGSLTKGRIDYSPFQEIFSTLENAVKNELVCNVAYLASRNSEPREYLFAPKRLTAYRETIYAEGWLLTSDNPPRMKYDDHLRLALQRFRACALTAYSSAGLPAIPQQKNELLGIVEDEPFMARIWFSGEVASYVAERIWSGSQQVEKAEGGSVILTLHIANFLEGLSWVLGFGDNAIVREPEWFVREVRRTLRRAARNYRRADDDSGRGENEVEQAG